MDGITLAKICDDECRARGISKAQFYKDIGLSAPSFHGWKNGSKPSKKYIDAIEKYFEIDLSDIEKSESDSETDEVLQWIREDFSHRALFESAKGLTKEQAYAAASFIEKLKAGET